MGKEVYEVEGIQIEYESVNPENNEEIRMKKACMFKAIREKSGMSRPDFASWLGVPYRTMQEWELGRRVMPEYVLRLIAYKVMNELEKGRI
ncbi:XRE family transcriptional regulator [Eubacterium sp.]|uniref:helix-turn-helix domain-containing protein n=1 Tax=Eubacterium sp. TaxID=142586 RepID=UPI002587175A|nr:XRE family transcriptional regulator [Eubacterium sp.]